MMLFAATAAVVMPIEPTTAQGRPVTTPSAHRNGAANVANGKIQYRVIGDLAGGKTPLLVLHGAYMTGDGMKPFSDQLAASRPVIVVDQRGHGRTGYIKGPITYELLADDAAAVIKAAGVKRVDVFGYSIGTKISLAGRRAKVSNMSKPKVHLVRQCVQRRLPNRSR